MTESDALPVSPKQVALQWIDSYNSHHPEIIASLYDEEVVNTQLPYERPVQGRQSMKMVFENIYRSFPDIHIEAENIIENDPWVVIEWVFSGTMIGDFAGQLPTHRKFSMKGCEIFKVINRMIVVQHGYWDKNTMFSQLNLK